MSLDPLFKDGGDLTGSSTGSSHCAGDKGPGSRGSYLTGLKEGLNIIRGFINTIYIMLLKVQQLMLVSDVTVARAVL